MAFVGGCEGDSSIPGAVVKDSAGIRIVTHRDAPRESDSSIGFADEPAVRLTGTEENGYLFQDIVTGVISPEGWAVVGDDGSKELVLFDSGGKLQAVFGGEGEGPREIGSIESIVLLSNERIVVEDDRNGRFAIFEKDSLIETVPSALVGAPFMWTVIGADSTGALLLASSAFPSSFEVPWWKGAVVRLSLAQRRLDTIARFDMVPSAEQPPNPFPARGELAVAGGQVISGRGDRPQLTWMTPSGQITRVARWPAERGSPSDSLWNVYEAHMRERMSTRAPSMVENRLRTLREGATHPVPLFSDLIGTHEGDVWIGEYAPGAMAPSRFTVLNPSGELLGVVEVPPSFRLLAATRDRVLGVEQDELDVQSVVVYEVTGTTHRRPRTTH